MVKRIIRKPKVQKTRVTRTEQYLINRKYLGDEPEPDEYLGAAYSRVLTWYNYMLGIDESREYLYEYLAKRKMGDVIRNLKNVPDGRYPITSGWIARLIDRGCTLHPGAERNMALLLKTALQYKEEPKTDEEGPSSSIQDRMKDKATDYIGALEEILDQDVEFEFSMYDWLVKLAIPPRYMNKFIDKYNPILVELLLVQEGEDDQLNEGYAHLSEDELESLIVRYNDIIEDCERYGTNTKKVRKPRKKKAQSVDKVLQHFKYKESDNEYKIASVKPEKIIGAQEVWVFNSKYKTLTVLRADGPGGLQIHRTAITKYNESTSQTKRIGRKTTDFLNRVLSSGKIPLRKLMDEINTAAILQDRCNENTVIMRVVT